ncbi:MAG: hypothetical protein QNJ16_00815 [Rhodobacter sp.]|nr:hypothetical protein [Rhodobacter sp.]
MTTTYRIAAADTVFSIAEALQIDPDAVCAALISAGGVAVPGLELSFAAVPQDGASEPQAGSFVEIPAGGVARIHGPGNFGLILVNASAENAVRYGVVSGHFQDEGSIAPESGEVLAPMTFEAPVYVANLNPHDRPATIRAAVATEEIQAALTGA